MYPDHTIWIPDGASDLQLSLCIIAHTGPAGHRGRKATAQAFQFVFKWSTLEVDVRAFVRAFIHWLATLKGKKIPRLYVPAVHGTSPDDLVQFDYIELKDS